MDDLSLRSLCYVAPHRIASHPNSSMMTAQEPPSRSPFAPEITTTTTGTGHPIPDLSITRMY